MLALGAARLDGGVSELSGREGAGLRFNGGANFDRGVLGDR